MYIIFSFHFLLRGMYIMDVVLFTRL